MPIDTAFVGALHVEYLKKRDLVEHEERAHHTLSQTSTIDVLLDGNYDGDVGFAELADGGDFGLGTPNALDGEMIALDGHPPEPVRRPPWRKDGTLGLWIRINPGLGSCPGARG